MVKNPPASVGDSGSIPGGRIRKILRRRKWQPTPVFLPRESHGQRSLMGSSPWGHKESDTTERLNTHTHTHTHTEESILEIILAQLSGHSCSSSRLTTLGLRTSSNTVRSLLHRQRLPLPLQVSKAHVKTSAIQGCQPRACLGHHLSIPSHQGNKVPNTL